MDILIKEFIMKIEHQHTKVGDPYGLVKKNSWDEWTRAISCEEKKKIEEGFIEFMSLEMRKHAKKMLEHLKKMKESH